MATQALPFSSILNKPTTLSGYGITDGLNNSLLSGKLYVGNASDIGTAVDMSGDVTISNAGVTAIGAGKVTNDMLAGSIAISKLSITGTPDATKFLRDDGSWQTVAAGITSLNGLTAATQTFAIGSTGTAPNWASVTDVHTLHLPDAGASATSGMMTNGTQTLAGAKTFSSDVTIASAQALLWSTDVSLSRNAPDHLAQRRGLNAQAFSLSETYTSSTNYGELRLTATAGGSYRLDSATGSSGTTRGIVLGKDVNGTKTDWLTIDTSGNVGIGASTPGAKLDVAGNVIVGGYRTSNELLINEYDSSKYGYITAGDSDRNYETGFILRYRDSSGNPQTAMTIGAGTGDIGIGVSTPYAKVGIKTSSTAGLTRALQIFNPYGSGGAVGIGFSVNSDVYPKGGIAYSHTGSYGVGDMLFLQGAEDANAVALSNVVMVIKNNGRVGIGSTTSPSAQLHVTQPAATSGSPTAFTITGALHTNLQASTEAPDVDVNLSRTVQFATGALTTQRAFRIQAPTYAFVGASTLSTATVLSISGPPLAGTNATITKKVALAIGTLGANAGEYGLVVTATSGVNTAYFLQCINNNNISVVEVSTSTTAFRLYNSATDILQVDHIGNNIITGSATILNFASGFGSIRKSGNGISIQSYDSILLGPGADSGGTGERTVSQRNGTNAQVHRVYNTYTSGTGTVASNTIVGEWGGIDWTATANTMTFGTWKGSSGGTARDLAVVSSSDLYLSGGSLTGTDQVGKHAYVQGGKGTGAGAPGTLIFQAGAVLGSGTTAHTLATAFTLTNSTTLTFADACNIAVNATTGTKIGTATSQKLSVWNATPVIQPTTGVAAATFVTNTSLIADDTATFDGYTIGQVVKALRNIGLLA